MSKFDQPSQISIINELKEYTVGDTFQPKIQQYHRTAESSNR